MPNKPIKDLTGKRYGRLVVIELHEKRKTGNGTTLYWKCRCDCGNETVSLGNGLKNGDTKSCGCLKIEELRDRRSIDLLGKKFGILSVISKDDDYVRPSNNGHSLRWICQCECGNEVSIVSSSLLSGITISCGCLSESFIANELKKYFIEKYNAKKEYRIFKNPKTNYYLPYDIYIPAGDNPKLNGYYIEIHGEQHYKISYFHKLQSRKNNTTPDEEFNKQAIKDKEKKKFASKYGVYIEINLLKKNSLESVTKYIENILESV